MDREFLRSQEILIPILGLKLIKETGNKIKWVDLVFINMQMEPLIKDNGKIINNMGRGSTNSPMGHFMKENGKIIWCMGLVSILILKERNGKGSSEMANFNPNFKNNWPSRDR